MSDPKHPTAQACELFDPVARKPPGGGQHLLCINPGGTLIVGPWKPGYLAWGFKPRIPVSVKARMAKAVQANIDRATAQEESTP
jgi:hypothetical protein